VAILAAAGIFMQAFGGVWTCHSQGHDVPWTISSAPGSSWTTVRWAAQNSAEGGIAYVGRLDAPPHWIYEDFHYDGSYATNTSAGPSGGTWTWQGTYYLGNRVLHGQVLWKRSSPQRIDRTFMVIASGKATKTGADYCTKT